MQSAASVYIILCKLFALARESHPSQQVGWHYFGEVLVQVSIEYRQMWQLGCVGMLSVELRDCFLIISQVAGVLPRVTSFTVALPPAVSQTAATPLSILPLQGPQMVLNKCFQLEGQEVSGFDALVSTLNNHTTGSMP